MPFDKTPKKLQRIEKRSFNGVHRPPTSASGSPMIETSTPSADTQLSFQEEGVEAGVLRKLSHKLPGLIASIQGAAAAGAIAPSQIPTVERAASELANLQSFLSSAARTTDPPSAGRPVASRSSKGNADGHSMQKFAEILLEAQGATINMRKEIGVLGKKIDRMTETKGTKKKTRVKNPDKAAFLGDIREHLRSLVQDEATSTYFAARDADVLSYEKNPKGPGPINGDKLRVDMDHTRLKLTKWNHKAADFFEESFVQEYPEHSIRLKKLVPGEPTVREAFWTSMRTVQTNYRKELAGESEAQKLARIKKRVQGRQRTVSYILPEKRLYLWEQLRQLRSEVLEDHAALGHLVPLLEKLGTQGMSPDSSDSEDTPRGKLTYKCDKPYRRGYLPWRSEALTKLLHDLDSLCKADRIAAKDERKGNWPHPRVDPADPQASETRAVRFLPRNCYDEVWYDQLTPSEADRLQATPVMDLTIDSDLQRIADRHRHVRYRTDKPLADV